MKLSPETVDILKNFASINEGLILRKGSVIRTLSQHKVIAARTRVQEDFPQDFPIYDLGKFLSVVAMFDDPDLEFEEKYVIISSGSQKTKYWAGDESIMQKPPEKDIEGLENLDMNLTLTKDVLEKVQKAGSVMGLSDISLVNEGGKVTIKCHEKKTDTSNTYTIDVGEVDYADFHVDLKAENLRMIKQDYDVQIAKQKVVTFTAGSLTYWIAAEQTSSI